ncbi:hypothetical protein L7U65_26425 [Klebsiella pneumoniae]|nr:hypothetical protein [Klebsiella pneumoniae]
MKEEGCGVDCATDTELVMSNKVGFDSTAISFTPNDTGAEEFVYARDSNAIISLAAYEESLFFEEYAGPVSASHLMLPTTACCVI